MKKLMIVAAAALGMTAFADIESVNVVGYTETALQGFKMLTPSFKNIENAGYPIDSFVVKGASDGTCSIQILDAKGQVAGSYYWYNEFVDGADVFPAGWFDATGAEPAGISLKQGEAAFFYSNETGVSVVSAGEVGGSFKHAVSGFGMLGNGSPVTIAVDAMTITGASDGTCSIQVLDSKGKVAGSYYWYNEFVDGADVFPAGWFDATGADPAGIDLIAGEAVLFYTNESGVEMSIPAAITEAE